MGDDHAAQCNLGRKLRQPARNIFIGKSMESVAAHSLAMEALGNGIMIRNRAVPAMKGGIETGDLRQLREALEQRADRR